MAPHHPRGYQDNSFLVHYQNTFFMCPNFTTDHTLLTFFSFSRSQDDCFLVGHDSYKISIVISSLL